MHTLFSLVIAYLAVVSHAVDSYILLVNGTDAVVGAHPYMVSLKYLNKYFCGGSIIAKRYILTAGHCVKCVIDPKIFEDVTIHAGTNLLSDSGYVYKPEAAIIHPKYVTFHNDIGLFRLKTDIEYNKSVQPISVARTNFVLDGDPCFVTGWGDLKVSGEKPDKLQILNLQVQSQEKCNATYYILDASHICAFSKSGQGACFGDSGSPLVANGIQIGIVSYGAPCAIGYPDVYTRTSSFTNWLTQYITE